MDTPVRSLSELDPDGFYTYADYCAWQFEGWEEIIDGRLTPRRGFWGTAHSRTAGNLSLALWRRSDVLEPFDADSLPMIAVALGGPLSATVVVPDYVIWRKPMLPRTHDYFEGVPLWLIEITKPGSEHLDWVVKHRLYERSGVAEYWIISPEAQTVTTYALRDGRYVLTGEWWEAGAIPSQSLPSVVVEWSTLFPADKS